MSIFWTNSKKEFEVASATVAASCSMAPIGSIETPICATCEIFPIPKIPTLLFSNSWFRFSVDILNIADGLAFEM